MLEGKVIEALRQIYDPEIPVNIHELGLIYNIHVNPDRTVHITMTLTAPACPVAGSLPGEVEQKVEAIPEVKSADVELVWEPPWSRDVHVRGGPADARNALAIFSSIAMVFHWSDYSATYEGIHESYHFGIPIGCRLDHRKSCVFKLPSAGYALCLSGRQRFLDRRPCRPKRSKNRWPAANSRQGARCRPCHSIAQAR